MLSPMQNARRRSSPLRSLVVALALVIPGHGAAEAARPAGIPEQDLKAAAIYNIIGFVEWPTQAFPAEDSPLVIGILGRGPVADLIGQFVANETWHGRPVVLRPLSTAAEGRLCHVVYIARSEHARWRTIRNQFSRLPILTLCDAEQFAQQGGILQLAIERNRLRLTVNLEAARAAGLTISAKILRLAQVIDSRGP